MKGSITTMNNRTHNDDIISRPTPENNGIWLIVKFIKQWKAKKNKKE